MGMGNVPWLVYYCLRTWVLTYASHRYNIKVIFVCMLCDVISRSIFSIYYTSIVQAFVITVLQSPEHVVVKVDHAVVAGLFTDTKGREPLAASQRHITGYLVDSAGNVIRQVSKPGKPDKVCSKRIIVYIATTGRLRY